MSLLGDLGSPSDVPEIAALQPAATSPVSAPVLPPSRSPGIERWLRPNRLMLIGLWLFAALHFYDMWPILGVVFRDADDAMRLTEVRDFLAGQGWYDLHQYRLDPPADIPMHWSRFIDLPIALLIRFFGLFLEPATATRAAMYVWPALPFLPVLWSSRAIAVRIGGEWAAFPAVYLLATLSVAVAQFIPGRVDHHNVQIALTMALLTLMVGPSGLRRGLLAGLTGAMMMAIGMETLPFLILVVIALSLRWVVEGDANGEAKAFGLSLALATVAVAGATLPISEWGRGACDALSLSYVSLAVVGGGGLALAARLAPRDWRGRLVALVGLGVVAIVAYAWPEPACLKGPFGQMLPEVRTGWLDDVNEVLPIWRVFEHEHLNAVLALATPVLAFLGFALLLGDGERRRDPGFWLMGAALATATLIGITQLRTLTYANVFAVPLVAAAIGHVARTSERRGRSITVTVLAGSVLANGMVLQLGLEQVVPASWRAEAAAASAVQAISSPAATAFSSAEKVGADASVAAAGGSPCYTLTNYATLAALPTGVVAAEVDLGPAILLATKHSVLGAPYHRMQRGILDSLHILNRPVSEAFAIMAARGVDYLAICSTSAKPAARGGIVDRLRSGSVPAGLEEVPGNGAVRVFRVHALPVLTAR